MDRGKRPFWRVIVRFAAVAAFVCVLPTVRTCGAVALGFPTVAVVNVYSSNAALRFPNLVVNLLSVGLIAFAVLLLYRRVKEEPGRSILAWGLRGFALYQALVAFGYAAVYPLLVNSGDKSIGAYVFAAYLYLVHPYFNLVGAVSDMVPAAVNESALFGDRNDAAMRLWWMAASLAWFGAGAGLRLIRNAAARRRGGSKGGTGAAGGGNGDAVSKNASARAEKA